MIWGLKGCTGSSAGPWRAAEPGWEDNGEGDRILSPLSYTWSGWDSRFRSKVCALNFVTVVISGCWEFLASFYEEEPERLRHVPKMSPLVRCWDLSSNPAVGVILGSEHSTPTTHEISS